MIYREKVTETGREGKLHERKIKNKRDGGKCRGNECRRGDEKKR